MKYKERIPFTEWAMKVCELIKERSTCLSRQVGAILVKDKRIIATGYNGAPSGCLHCTDIGYCLRNKMGFESGQGLEYCRAAHAESNCLDECARYGNSAYGATMYVTAQPCSFCAIRIIQAGVKKVVFKGDYPSELTKILFKEAGVELVKYEEELKNEIEKEKIKKNKIKEKIKTYEEKINEILKNEK